MSLIIRHSTSGNKQRCHIFASEPEMPLALCTAIAYDKTLAKFTARWERTTLELFRMNDIDLVAGKPMFNQHRADDETDLEFVFNYISSHYNKTVCEMWSEWIIAISIFRHHAETAQANW